MSHLNLTFVFILVVFLVVAEAGTRIRRSPQFGYFSNRAGGFGGNWFHRKPGFAGPGYGGPGFGNPGFWNQSFVCNGTQVPPWPPFDQLINNATAFGGNWFFPNPGFGGPGYGNFGFGSPGFWNHSFVCNGK